MTAPLEPMPLPEPQRLGTHYPRGTPEPLLAYTAEQLTARDAAWASRLEAAESRVAELEKDAARWRWARAHPIVMDDYAFSIDEEVEAFVDSAIAKGA